MVTTVDKNPRIKELRKKKKELEKKEEKLSKKIRKKCPHDQIKKGGGGTWTEWPDWGIYSYWYECLICGEKWNSPDWVIADKLVKHIVKDESRKATGY